MLKLYCLTNEKFLNCILEVKQTVFVVKIYATLSQKYLSLYVVQIISKYLVLSYGQQRNLGVQCFYNQDKRKTNNRKTVYSLFLLQFLVFLQTETRALWYHKPVLATHIIVSNKIYINHTISLLLVTPIYDVWYQITISKNIFHIIVIIDHRT